LSGQLEPHYPSDPELIRRSFEMSPYLSDFNLTDMNC
jgi:hypothetical protein